MKRRSALVIGLVLLLTACGAERPPSTDDDYIADLLSRCHRGDLQACDTAYMETPIGSPEEEYGLTCGGRRSVDDTFYSCVEQEYNDELLGN